MSDTEKRVKLDDDDDEEEESSEDDETSMSLDQFYDKTSLCTKKFGTAAQRVGYIAVSNNSCMEYVRETEEECVLDIVDQVKDDIEDEAINNLDVKNLVRDLRQRIDTLNEDEFVRTIRDWDIENMDVSWRIETVRFPCLPRNKEEEEKKHVTTIEDQCKFIIQKVDQQLRIFPKRETCIVYFGSILRQFPGLKSIEREKIRAQFSIMNTWKIRHDVCLGAPCFSIDIE